MNFGNWEFREWNFKKIKLKKLENWEDYFEKWNFGKLNLKIGNLENWDFDNGISEN